jgi:anaerobic magnesium-protoporphyrin IX monomethyl ester cyclase
MLSTILSSMKVLLVQPPIEDFYDTSIRTYPLSLLYLATKIKDICDVSVVDLRSNKKRMLKTHPFPELKPFYRANVYTPFSLFHSYSRFGMNREEISQIIATSKPDVVGISSLFTTYAEEALDVARIVKNADARIINVMGGNHPTLFPEHCLRSPYVDYVIRGEGETPLFKLITELTKGDQKNIETIPGVSFRNSAGFHISGISIEENIDLIPDRRFIDCADHRIGRRPYTFFLTSRGCPFQCAFCGKPPVPYRKRTLASIEEEIRQCVELGIEAVDFEDDMLNLDIPFFNSILDWFKDTGIVLSAMNGLYAGNLTRETLDNMYDAGFRRLNFSLVDTSEDIHHRQKRAFPAHLAGLLTELEATPFLVEAHFIIGLPGQRRDDSIDTLIYLMGKRLLPGPSVYYLAPGSPLFNAACGNDWQKYIKVMRSSALYPSNPLFPRETLFTFMKITRFINHVKNIIDQNPSITRLSDIIDLPAIACKPQDLHIFKTLIFDKRFVWYDKVKEDYVEEPQDKDLTVHFFEKIKGKPIRGFKTMNTLIVDI